MFKHDDFAALEIEIYIYMNYGHLHEPNITYRYFHFFGVARDIPIQGWAAPRCDFSEALRCPCKLHVAWSHRLWCLGHLGRSRPWFGLVWESPHIRTTVDELDC